jgi:GntR family transcriptional repressor for pyruvate dehydrogenase complex
MKPDMTADTFTPVRSLRLSEEIIRQIARLIEEGSLQINDRFPTERDLQERWQVSRPVLREAFRVLEMQGVVESRPGAGRYLRSGHIPDIDRQRRQRLQANTAPLMEVWDAREAVECKAAEHAARRATEAQIGEIRRALEVLDAASFEDLRHYDINREFHMSVAKASGNLLIEQMIDGLIARSNAIGFKEALRETDHEDLKGRHRPIYEAIRGRDPEAARRAVVSHFDGMRRNVGR